MDRPARPGFTRSEAVQLESLWGVSPAVPPVVTGAEHGRIVGPSARSPAERAGGDSRPDGADQLGSEPQEGQR